MQTFLKREIESELQILLTEYPIVTILGPRQAGKTTLARTLLAQYAYANLEHPETRAFAEGDPKEFLDSFSGKVILDEIQRVPLLLSYIQTIVDEKKIKGQFILTGSHQLDLRAAISQSLAGRTAILHLLPLSIKEAGLQNADMHFSELSLKGFLPVVHSEKLRVAQVYANYYRTYVERDVRKIINVKDIALFEKFMKLFAGRVGQVMNFASLSNDVGVDVKTIQSWLGVLEASYLIFKLSPYYKNYGKRIIKSPKYYFTDTGLLCFLLGIETSAQLKRDPLVGNIFENMVVLEVQKGCFNRGREPFLYYFRDSNGNEVDLIMEKARHLHCLEIKSSATYSNSFKRGLTYFSGVVAGDLPISQYIAYSGETRSLSADITMLNYKDIDQIFE